MVGFDVLYTLRIKERIEELDREIFRKSVHIQSLDDLKYLDKLREERKLLEELYWELI